MEFNFENPGEGENSSNKESSNNKNKGWTPASLKLPLTSHTIYKYRELQLAAHLDRGKSSNLDRYNLLINSYYENMDYFLNRFNRSTELDYIYMETLIAERELNKFERKEDIYEINTVENILAYRDYIKFLNLRADIINKDPKAFQFSSRWNQWLHSNADKKELDLDYLIDKFEKESGYYPSSEEILSWLNKQSNEPKVKVKINNSFQWQGTEEQLKELHNKIIIKKDRFNLIDPDTKKEAFLAIFSGSFIEPIKWTSGNATELLYFILQLQEFEFLYKPKRQNYRAIKNCFVKQNGDLFNESFKNLIVDIEINLSEKKQSLIKELLENII